MKQFLFQDRSMRRLRSAFTLSEVLIATGVGVLILAMSLGVLLALTRVYYRTDIKNSVSEDYRDLSRLMLEQGNLSNSFYIYASASSADRNKHEKRVAPGGSGDLVVFVYYSVSDIVQNPNMQGVSRVLGFFREQPSSASDFSPKPIRYFDSGKQSWPGSPSPTAPVFPSGSNKQVIIESLIPSEAFLSTCPVLVDHTMGAAKDASDKLKLFYNSSSNLYGPSLNVTGYIIRSRGTTGGGFSEAAYQSRTAFNFTVSPRIAN